MLRLMEFLPYFALVFLITFVAVAYGIGHCMLWSWRARPISFKYAGQRYVRHPNGQFFDRNGLEITDDELIAGLSMAYTYAYERKKRNFTLIDGDMVINSSRAGDND